jgi:ABC-type multidrug transport system fused ATPase/permease subunit
MPRNFAELVDVFLSIISLVIPLIFSLALLVIVWKIIEAWVLNPGDQTKIDEGKQYALWGILVLVVMSGFWAIVGILRGSLFGV